MSNEIIIIGLGRLGSRIAEVLLEEKKRIIIFEKDEEKINSFLQDHPNENIVLTDVTSNNFAENYKLFDYYSIIVTIITNVEASLVVTNHIQEAIKKNNKKNNKSKQECWLSICAGNKNHESLLKKIGDFSNQKILSINNILGEELAFGSMHHVKSYSFLPTLLNDQKYPQCCFLLKIKRDMTLREILSPQFIYLDKLKNDKSSLLPADETKENNLCIGLFTQRIFLSAHQLTLDHQLVQGDQLLLFAKVNIIAEMEKKLSI